MAQTRFSISRLGLALAAALLLAACGSRPENVTRTDELPQIYPDYVGVTVPSTIAPLNFCMADEDVTTIDVEVRGSKAGQLHANGAYADFDIDEWHSLLAQNRGGELRLTVCAEKEGRWTQYREFAVAVSNDDLGEWGVTYRRIPPSYEIYSMMGLYQRDLSSFSETELLVNTRTPDQCLNCHTANRTNPDQWVFHVRGSHGATVIQTGGRVELLQARNDTLGGSMVYPYWHPSGRYCAFSTNKTSQMFHTTKKNKRIEVYDASSDVFVYDVERHTILRDSLTMKALWAENTPAFSPDGRWLYFTTALRQVYPTDYDKEMYSICRVAFDAATGRLGSQVDTLVNTRLTGKSASWPRLSYDGRYLMYTQTDYGYFTIWHPEADLWLMDTATGETRPMDEVNSRRAESFHNWSANSRWFLFTSRCEDGLYTRLYFAHFADGKAAKPFLLPQRNPRDYYRRLMHSYNTPDFTSRPVEMDARRMAERIESGERVATKTE